VTRLIEQNDVISLRMGAILLQNMGGQLGVKPTCSSGWCRSEVL